MRTGVRLDDSPFHTCSLFLKCCGTFPSWGKVTVPVIYRHLGVKEAIGTWMFGELCMSISKDITFPSVSLAWTPFSLYRCSYETKCSLYHHIQMPGMNGLLLIMARKTIWWDREGKHQEGRKRFDFLLKSTKAVSLSSSLHSKQKQLRRWVSVNPKAPHPLGLCIDAENWQLHIHTLITTLSPHNDFTPCGPNLIWGLFSLWWNLIHLALDLSQLMMFRLFVLFVVWFSAQPAHKETIMTKNKEAGDRTRLSNQCLLGNHT